jgi:hypothetical protein
MFKWEPIEKLQALSPELKRKLGRILIGRATAEGDLVFLSNWMGHKWANDHIQPTHFMLLEPLPTE